MYLRPGTLDEAVKALAEGGAAILSGGTDFYPALSARPVRGTVLDISGLKSLAGIAVEPETIRIGASTTWTELIETELPRCFDGLKAAAREVGSIQIQNRGTIGGNLCNASPAADGVPPLLTLDAEVELTSAGGRRLLPLGEFILGNRRTALRPGELMTAVLVPRRMENAISSFFKLGSRRYLVISVVMVAAAVEVTEDARIADARIAVGACSPVARRLTVLEAALKGQPVAPGLGSIATAQHLEALSPIDDIRASGRYRLDAAVTLVRRLLDTCAMESST